MKYPMKRSVIENRLLDRLNAFDELTQLVKTAPSVPDSTVYDAGKEERLRDRGLLYCNESGLRPAYTETSPLLGFR
jgi:hypothetical protein